MPETLHEKIEVLLTHIEFLREQARAEGKVSIAAAAIAAAGPLLRVRGEAAYKANPVIVNK